MKQMKLMDALCFILLRICIISCCLIKLKEVYGKFNGHMIQKIE